MRKPKPFSVIATIVYLMVYGSIVLDQGVAPGSDRGIAVAVALSLLWLLDRLAPQGWDAAPRRWHSVLLMVAQFGLIEVVGRFGDQAAQTFLHCLIVYRAGWQFGAAGIYTVAFVAWGFAFWEYGLPLLLAPSWLMLGQRINDLAWSSFLLLLVAAIAHTRSAEHASRIRVDHLVVELQRAHTQLRVFADHALAAVKERNELARAVHEQLGQALTAIHVQLAKAQSFRSLDPEVAEQAIHDAKALGSAALQDVRRSVRMLRAPQTDTLPRYVEPPATPELDRTAKRGSATGSYCFNLAPSVVYLSIFAMYAGWSIQELGFWSTTTYGVLGVLLGMVVLDRLDGWLLRRFPGRLLAAALLVLRLVGYGLVVALQGIWYSFWILLIMPYYGFVYFGAKGGKRVSVVAWLALLGSAIAIAIGDEGKYLAGFVAGLIAFTLIQLLIMSTSMAVLDERRHREQAEDVLTELQSAHAALQSYAAQALAARTERAHLAREIHDGLGHYLTVINVQLEKAIAFRPVDARIADHAAQTTLQLVNEALHEVRGTTKALGRGDECFSLLTALEHIIRHLGSNLQVDLWTAGHEHGFGQQHLLVLYRIAQEGLTNIEKHARASHVRLDLCFGEHEAILTIEDNGLGFELRPDVPASGRQEGCYGLRGARERVELLGGVFELRSTPGSGTQLRVSLPRVAPEAHLPAHSELKELRT